MGLVAHHQYIFQIKIFDMLHQAGKAYTQYKMKQMNSRRQYDQIIVSRNHGLEASHYSTLLFTFTVTERIVFSV